eukprot:COSAG02_NODE_417_length_22746_cov_9.074172_13_plen_129_part_00
MEISFSSDPSSRRSADHTDEHVYTCTQVIPNINNSEPVDPSHTVYGVKSKGSIEPIRTCTVSLIQYDFSVTGRLTAAMRRHREWKSESTDQLEQHPRRAIGGRTYCTVYGTSRLHVCIPYYSNSSTTV